MSIPPNIAANWPEFVAEWCLGIEPVETPSEVERSFDALRRLWPEFLNQLEVRGAQGDRGIYGRLGDRTRPDARSLRAAGRLRPGHGPLAPR
jgi:hypothetical protein